VDQRGPEHEYQGGVEDVFFGALLGINLGVLLTKNPNVGLDAILAFLIWITPVIVALRMAFESPRMSFRVLLYVPVLISSYLALVCVGLASYVAGHDINDAIGLSFVAIIFFWILTVEFRKWQIRRDLRNRRSADGTEDGRK
jgi:hypothetical protein